MQTETKVNGAPLDGKHAQAYEYGLAAHLEVEQRLAQALQQIDALTLQLKQAEVENESLRSFNNLCESRVIAAVADRDAAVDSRAKLAALLGIMHTAMHEAAIADFTRETGVDK